MPCGLNMPLPRTPTVTLIVGGRYGNCTNELSACRRTFWAYGSSCSSRDITWMMSRPIYIDAESVHLAGSPQCSSAALYNINTTALSASAVICPGLEPINRPICRFARKHDINICLAALQPQLSLIICATFEYE